MAIRYRGNNTRTHPNRDMVRCAPPIPVDENGTMAVVTIDSTTNKALVEDKSRIGYDNEEKRKAKEHQRVDRSDNYSNCIVEKELVIGPKDNNIATIAKWLALGGAAVGGSVALVPILAVLGAGLGATTTFAAATTAASGGVAVGASIAAATVPSAIGNFFTGAAMSVLVVAQGLGTQGTLLASAYAGGMTLVAAATVASGTIDKNEQEVESKSSSQGEADEKDENQSR